MIYKNKKRENKYGIQKISSVSHRKVAPHVKVWEEYMQTEVPFDDDGKRCVIHHLDQDTTNNDILNLVCMTKSEHDRWHHNHIGEETRKKMSEVNQGKKHTEEAKKKMSEIAKNKKHKEETKRKISEAHIGKKLSDETKKKMSESKLGKKYRLGKKLSEESKEKMRISAYQGWKKRRNKENML